VELKVVATAAVIVFEPVPRVKAPEPATAIVKAAEEVIRGVSMLVRTAAPALVTLQVELVPLISFPDPALLNWIKSPLIAAEAVTDRTSFEPVPASKKVKVVPVIVIVWSPPKICSREGIEVPPPDPPRIVPVPRDENTNWPEEFTYKP
jgi:hypothetical protein